MIHEETFAPLASTIEKLRRLRLAAPAAVALLALVCLAVIRQLTLERKLLLFDLGIGLVLSAGLYFVARRLIASEAEHRCRIEMAILIGVATAGGVLGIIAVALAGTPLGVGKLPQLLIIQLLGAMIGAAISYFVGFLLTLVISMAQYYVLKPTTKVDGAWVGGLCGVAVGLSLYPAPNLGLWFAVTAAIVAAAAGYRAAQMYERLRH